MAARSSACSTKGSAFGRSASLSTVWLLASVMVSAVHVGHYEIDGRQQHDQVRDHAAIDDEGDHLQVREAGRADAGAVAHGAAVGDAVIAVDALGRLDQLRGFAG